MNDLLPCPFCGGEAHEFETEHDSEYQYQVQCRGCGAEIAFWSPWTAGAGQRATAALDCVERWNRRALPAASQPEAAPVVWVIPGYDTEDCNGFIDAMAWEEGEFTRPLYAHPTPAPVVPAEGLEWAICNAEAAISGYSHLTRNVQYNLAVPINVGQLRDMITALRAQQSAAPVSGVTVQEAARVLLTRLQYSSEADFLDAMQQVMPTEQTADLYAGLTAALSALEGK